MRGLMLLSLVTLAVSAPQGFNYADMQHLPHLEYGPVPASTTTLDFLKNLQSLMTVQTANIGTAESYASNSIEQYARANLPTTPQQQYLAPNFAVTTNHEASSNHYAQQTPIISKRFFLHSAPEDDDTEVQEKHIIVGKPRKNFNVVFIRAPAKAAQRTSLKISPAVSEDKTLIYVLAKKPEAADIDAHVLEPVTTTSRPEVFFIKYKTHEEAEHAQRTIQSQYDALGGSTLISNEGISPVSSVIGSLDASKHSANNELQYAPVDVAQQQHSDEGFVNVQAYQSQQTQPEDGTSSNNGYLPPTLRKY